MGMLWGVSYLTIPDIIAEKPSHYAMPYLKHLPNNGRCVNHGMKKAAGWVDQSVTFLEKFYLVSVRLHCRSASSSATLLSASAVSFCASIFSFSAESAL